MLNRAVHALAIAVLLGACGEDAEEPTITRERFVEVIVQLRQADAATNDPTVFETRKAAILDSAGVTDSMLLAYARVHAADIAHMAEVWDTISQRLIRADTVPR